MSTDASPIPPHLFAAAIQDLPLSNVYAKAAELQNSISHLLASNVAMQPFAQDGDADCREAIVENDGVIARMEERIRLCQAEVESRGARWSTHAQGLEAEPGEETGSGSGLVNGHMETATEGTTTASAPAPARSGRLTDEELRRQLEARMGADEASEEDEEGVHL